MGHLNINGKYLGFIGDLDSDGGELYRHFACIVLLHDGHLRISSEDRDTHFGHTFTWLVIDERKEFVESSVGFIRISRYPSVLCCDMVGWLKVGE